MIVNVKCGQCGIILSEMSDHPILNRKPCSKCSFLARFKSVIMSDKIQLHEFVEGKKKDTTRPSKKKLRVHIQQGDQINHETGQWILKEQRIDKDKKPSWYFESITDPMTGKILHQYNESLDDHVGHGSAKQKEV